MQILALQVLQREQDAERLMGSLISLGCDDTVI